jgi:hypothetical protein
MAFRITSRLREFYRYTGVSADIERKGRSHPKETIMLSNLDLARLTSRRLRAARPATTSPGTSRLT